MGESVPGYAFNGHSLIDFCRGIFGLRQQGNKFFGSRKQLITAKLHSRIEEKQVSQISVF